MKLLAISLGAALLCCIGSTVFGSNEPANLGLGALVQFSSTNASPVAAEIQVPLLAGTNVAQPRAGLESNWLSWSTNLSVPFVWGTNAPMIIGKGKTLSPGTYLSQPYSMLVIVPSTGGDDKMVVSPSQGFIAQMRIIEPEVELVPWPTAVEAGPGK